MIVALPCDALRHAWTALASPFLRELLHRHAARYAERSAECGEHAYDDL